MTYPSTGEVQVGSVLRDTYEIVALIGYGGMGSVFVARHLRLRGKQVAVKVLHAQSGLNAEVFRRFKREAEIASRLGHPNIVEVHDFDQLPSGTPFLVLELLRGESLAQRLHKGRLTWPELQPIARQVGSALRAAHRAGVVHRDLKPDNIFLTPNETGGEVSERVKLLDFGISKMTTEPSTMQTQDQILMGTPLYMSPEQAQGNNRDTDARTDIFALGSILYEALTGRSPFEAENIPKIVYRIVHEAPAPLAELAPGAPARAVAAIERALAKKVEDRYPDVGAFIADLTGVPLQTLSSPNVPAAAAPSGSSASGNDEIASTFISQSRQVSPSEAEAALPAASAPAVAAGLSPLAAPPSAPDTIPNAPRRGRVLPWLALPLVAAVAFGGWRLVRGAPATEPSVPQQPPRPGPTEPTPTPVPPEVDPDPTPKPPPPVVEPEPTPPPAGDPTPRPGSSRGPAAELSRLHPEARELLAQAERELTAGNADRALDLARRAERTAGIAGADREATFTVANWVLVRAYCLAGNLGDARPLFFQLPRTWRPSVRVYCKKHNVEFTQ